MTDDLARQSECGCSEGNWGRVSRRDFLRMTGAASAFALAGGLCCGEETTSSLRIRKPPHLIPAEKNLPTGWLRALTERGTPVTWRGEELRTIGMPVGGIGTGQLYLCGDGTLGLWEIFNHHEFIGWGGKNYARRTIPKPVQHGIAVLLRSGDKEDVRLLDSTGFADVQFQGDYPIGKVRYADPATPIVVTLEAFSPFIPLNEKDSALPATFMVVTIENKGATAVDVAMLSWLENAVAKIAGEQLWRGKRRIRVVRDAAGTRMLIDTHATGDGKPQPTRPTVVLADFEGPDYAAWEASGAAFPKPAKGTLPTQQNVSGFQGKQLVNSFVDRDATTGTLTSPTFTVERKYINFLIGGGREGVGMRLLVDGAEMRTASGSDSEQLRWRSWDVAEFEGKIARIVIFDQSTTGWGHVNVDQIEFSDVPRREMEFDAFEQYPDFGSMTWGCVEETVPVNEAAALGSKLPQGLRDKLQWTDSSELDLDTLLVGGLATKIQKLEPGKSTTFQFLLTWHFPNTTQPSRDAGHEYAARFADAEAVAKYALENRERLIGDTRKWRDTFYGSTLPYWLLHRLHLTASCLATGTAMWWKNGRFWAWEGVVCCEGTCTHVWNYSQSLARLFPGLERIVRELQDLGAALQPDGLVGFRGNNVYAADGQCGTVLKAWREHLMSADDKFLRRNWPAIKKVMDYSIQQDGNADGLIESSQHNTYDINFFGPNTFVGSLYLGALRAGEQMAREMGENEYADRLHRLFESGRKTTEEKLWNGEYFTQAVDLKQHPRDQYGPGCLADQLFGQNWAHQASLGYLYGSDKVRKALESVWKYNWAPDTGTYNDRYPPERPYTEDEEAGLFICTWPNSTHLDQGVRYRDEVWTGIEYQVASHMIYEGLVQEGLAVCRAVDDRYQAAKRNPYNEVECSDFYARAMASWGVLLALSGYEYHGPQGRLVFAPRITPDDFRCAFTAAEGWGSFQQKVNGGSGKWTIEMKYGKLSLKTVEFGKGNATAAPTAAVLDGTALQAKFDNRDGRYILSFAEPTVINAGSSLVVS